MIDNLERDAYKALANAGKLAVAEKVFLAAGTTLADLEAQAEAASQEFKRRERNAQIARALGVIFFFVCLIPSLLWANPTQKVYLQLLIFPGILVIPVSILLILVRRLSIWEEAAKRIAEKSRGRLFEARELLYQGVKPVLGPLGGGYYLLHHTELERFLTSLALKVLQAEDFASKLYKPDLFSILVPLHDALGEVIEAHKNFKGVWETSKALECLPPSKEQIFEQARTTFSLLNRKIG